jgi:hypothetical protein
VFVAMAALLLQISAVPQILIPAAPATNGRLSAPTADGPAASGNTDSPPRPVPGVAYVPGQLTLEPVGPAVSPASAKVPAEAPGAFRSVAAQEKEDRRRRDLWRVLSVAQHSAAAFDAWSTRRAIVSGQARERNPLLRPFAGNASLYVAIQAGPVLLDYLSRRMMTSRHGWERRTWWVPQAVSTAVSLASGFHNLGVPSSGTAP